MRPLAFKLVPGEFLKIQKFCRKSAKISISLFGKWCSWTLLDRQNSNKTDRVLCYFSTGPQWTNSSLQTVLGSTGCSGAEKTRFSDGGGWLGPQPPFPCQLGLREGLKKIISILAELSTKGWCYSTEKIRLKFWYSWKFWLSSSLCVQLMTPRRVHLKNPKWQPGGLKMGVRILWHSWTLLLISASVRRSGGRLLAMT